MPLLLLHLKVLHSVLRGLKLLPDFSLTKFQVELLDFELGLTRSAHVTLTSLFRTFDFDFADLLPHHVTTEHRPDFAECRTVSPGKLGLSELNPSELNLQLRYTILRPSSKNLKYHAETVDHSDLARIELGFCHFSA
jgi:hypothetical protein